MTANEFIKKFGLVAAKKHLVDVREAVNQVPHKHSLEDFSVDLKILIESHELVEKWGGLDDAKVAAKSGRYYGYLKKAIADVESCHV